MSKQKKQPPPAKHDETSAPLPTITDADVARILATPDDVLMAWFRAGQEEARRMKSNRDKTVTLS